MDNSVDEPNEWVKRNDGTDMIGFDGWTSGGVPGAGGGGGCGGAMATIGAFSDPE